MRVHDEESMAAVIHINACMIAEALAVGLARTLDRALRTICTSPISPVQIKHSHDNIYYRV